MAAMEYTKTFTISVVLGKDVVPRLGLNQMEALRADLINAIKRSVDPKVIFYFEVYVIILIQILVEDYFVWRDVLLLFDRTDFGNRTVDSRSGDGRLYK